MVAMNVERVNETAGVSLRLCRRSDAANVIAVSLMTESEQMIAVHCTEPRKLGCIDADGSPKKAPTASGRGAEEQGQGSTPLPEETVDIVYGRNNVCAGPTDSRSIADSWYGCPDSRGEHGSNHDAHCCSLHVHGALLFDEDR